jgi:flavin reductase (DIM6/NTAB) family NADH-FMN oxidoreductase RutF
MAVKGDEFRHALGHLAAGVSVITADIPGERLAGMTATAVCSLSLTPPLVLVCIDHRAWLHDRLTVGQAFAINLLAADQQDVSHRFASKTGDRFAETAHKPGATGAPIIDGVLGAIECRVVERHSGGDHTIVVGEVDSTTIGEAQPLLHWRGKYGNLA